MRRAWVVVFICLAGAYFSWRERPISHAPGVLIAQEPLQAPLSEAPPAFEKNGYHIKPLAHFEVSARVLAKKRYRFDSGAAVAPIDLALGWGKMSDSAVLERLAISQGGRFYAWRAAALPIPRQEIETHSANMHLIPATQAIAKRLKAVRQGSIVRLSGYLAEVSAANGFRWTSSLSRDDTGQGACELVWVEELSVQ